MYSKTIFTTIIDRRSISLDKVKFHSPTANFIIVHIIRYDDSNSYQKPSSVKKYKKTPTLLGGHFICWHLPIFPGRHQPSIFGTTELNFCVRYGNRWTLSVINTNLLTFVSLLRTVLIILRAAPNVNTFFKKI